MFAWCVYRSDDDSEVQEVVQVKKARVGTLGGALSKTVKVGAMTHVVASVYKHTVSTSKKEHTVSTDADGKTVQHSEEQGLPAVISSFVDNAQKFTTPKSKFDKSKMPKTTQLKPSTNSPKH